MANKSYIFTSNYKTEIKKYVLIYTPTYYILH